MENSIYEQLTTLDFFVVALYMIIVVAIGFLVSFIKKRKSNENLFLAEHSLGWKSIGLNMWGTNVGPSMLVASAAAGYTSGLVRGNFGWYAFIFIFLLAVVFAPRYLKSKVQTLPEFMGKRFGDSTRNFLAWYTLVTILVSWLALTLYAGGIIVQQVTGFSLFISIVILVIIATFFTLAGGLKTIAYTNVFQMSLLIIVSFIITVYGLYKAGIMSHEAQGIIKNTGFSLAAIPEMFKTTIDGAKHVYNETPPKFWNLFLSNDDPDFPWIAIILGYPVMGVWFWCTDQSMVQSVLGAKNLKQGQYGANFTGWLKILDVALFIIPGITCLVLFPNLENSEEAYMTMVTGLLPTGLVGLVMAVIIAALVSTIDSSLNSLSAVFTLDIYTKKYKKNADQKEIVRIGRIVTVIGAVIAIFMALSIQTIDELNLFDKFQAILGFIAPPISVVFLFGILWKKTTPRAANIVLSVGTIFSFSIGILYLFIFPSDKYDFWPHFMLISFYIFVILCIVAFVVTLTDKKGIENKQNTLSYSSIEKPSVKQWFMWILLIVTMVALYIIFNGH